MKKNVTIDRLRGACVLAVISMHTLFFFPNTLTFLGQSLWNGYYGVTAFFCTSGFLITTGMLQRYGQVAKVDLYAFYVMRFGRIVPALVLLCVSLAWLSTTSIETFHFVAPITLKDTLLNIVKLRYNHYYERVGSHMLVWSILWSLTIEEVFYLAYPVTAKLVRNTKALVGVLLAVIAYATYHRRGSIMTIYDYFGCFDGIAWGALAALAARRFGRGINRPVAWVVMLTGLAGVGGTYAGLLVNDHYNLGLSLIAVGAALILFASQCAPFADTRLSSRDLLAYVGSLSYEMYLFHMAVFASLATIITPRFPALVFTVAIFCVVGVSDLIARFYAEPLNRWLRTVLLAVRPARAVIAVPVPLAADRDQ